MKIDVHNHAFPERVLELLRRDPAYGVTLTGSRWHGGMHVDFDVVDAFVDPAAKLAELERKELDGAIVSVAPPLFYYHVDPDLGEAMAVAGNEGLQEICAFAPDRFGWLATVPLQAPERAAAVLADALAAGCVGVHVGTSAAGRRIDDDFFEPFWAAAERLGLPVMIHPIYNEPNRALEDFYFENVIGNQLETTVAIERLICAGTLDRHPGLQLVLVHAGGYFPWQAGRLRHARQFRPELAGATRDPWSYLDQLWFDTITHDRANLAHLVARVGADRVVLGTDLPFDMATPEPVADLRAAVGEETMREIAEANAVRLYPRAPSA
ncbi:MAG TPA: amidohydrolase family protein [Baekduia sp.]